MWANLRRDLISLEEGRRIILKVRIQGKRGRVLKLKFVTLMSAWKNDGISLKTFAPRVREMCSSSEKNPKNEKTEFG